MTFLRFRYQGQSANDRAYSGALGPLVRRRVENQSVITRGDDDAPVFGRKVYDESRNVFLLRWPSLSHAEAQSLVTQWEDAARGANAVYYTPDDQSEPITLVPTEPPVINYLSAAVAAVSQAAEEQR